jgi:hypothetical protein
MKTALRTFAAILAGLLLAFILVVAVELFSAVVHPFPEDFKGTTEEVCAHVERYPAWVLAVVVPVWAATAFLGVWIAQSIGNLFSSATVGLLLLAAVVLNVSMLPYPLWFKVANLIAVPAAIIAGMRWTRHRTELSQERGAEQ